MFRVVGRTDHIIRREAERAGAGQSGAEQVQGQLSHVRKCLTGGCKGARPSSVLPREKDRKQWHRLKYKKFFLNLWKKIIFNYKRGQTEVQIS